MGENKSGRLKMDRDGLEEIMQLDPSVESPPSWVVLRCTYGSNKPLKPRLITPVVIICSIVVTPVKMI